MKQYYAKHAPSGQLTQLKANCLLDAKDELAREWYGSGKMVLVEIIYKVEDVVEYTIDTDK